MSEQATPLSDERLNDIRAFFASYRLEGRLSTSISCNAAEDLLAEIDRLKGELVYEKEWKANWHKIAMENKKTIDQLTQGNSLIVQGANNFPMTPLGEQVCVICGKEARGAQNVGQIVSASDRWEWRCEAHRLVAVTCEQLRKSAAQLAAKDAEIARLRMALREYGEHNDSCPLHEWEDADDPDCTCGLRAAVVGEEAH